MMMCQQWLCVSTACMILLGLLRTLQDITNKGCIEFVRKAHRCSGNVCQNGCLVFE